MAKRLAAINTATGLPAGASIAAADRARVRTKVAWEFYLAEHGRKPVDARELKTFSRKADAERHLTAVEGAKLSGA